VLVASWAYLYGVHTELIGPGHLHQIDRKTIVSKLTVEIIAFSAVGIAILGVVVKTWLRTAPILVQESFQVIRDERAREGGGTSTLKPALAAAAKEVATGGMRDCEDFQQWFAHLLIMWGFVGLFVTTALDAVVNKPADPLPLLHPVRLLGNVTGTLFLAGLTLAMVRRGLLDRVRQRSQASDWTFLISLWGTGATGFLVQWYADLADLPNTRWSYTVHLAFVAGLLVSAPWTKFLHAVWRPSWALYRALTAPRR
jgi:hypothetical protein